MILWFHAIISLSHVGPTHNHFKQLDHILQYQYNISSTISHLNPMGQWDKNKGLRSFYMLACNRVLLIATIYSGPNINRSWPTIRLMTVPAPTVHLPLDIIWPRSVLKLIHLWANFSFLSGISRISVNVSDSIFKRGLLLQYVYMSRKIAITLC